MALKNGNCVLGQNEGCNKLCKSRMSWPESILDFLVFITVSIGIIIKVSFRNVTKNILHTRMSLKQLI